MNTRIIFSAALAAAGLSILAPAQAQAPGADSKRETQKLETKIALMQQQINALQSQVKQLQQQLIQTRFLAGLPNPGVNPFYRVPNTLPNFTLPNTAPPLVVPQPRRSNIPDCQITLIDKAQK